LGPALTIRRWNFFCPCSMPGASSESISSPSAFF
jgi:hypothetical protein